MYGGLESAAAALDRLVRARSRLILERPFIGALAVHLALVANARCATVATDARAIYFNPAYVSGLTLAQAQFVIAHEALHCGLSHFARRGSRLADRWDRACDHAVNQLLRDDGFTLAPGFAADARFRGLAAEAIYPLLEREFSEPAGDDEHWFGAASDQGGEGAPQTVQSQPDAHRQAEQARTLEAHRDGIDELGTRGAMTHAALASEWEDRLASTANAALLAGRLSPHWRAVLPEVFAPRLPWQALLARFLMYRARDDYSYQRPGRRSSEALLPGLASTQLTLIAVLDTSGSIGREDFRAFLDELDALKGQLTARLMLFACDDAIAPGAPWTFEPWQPLAMPQEIAGGGSTRFTPVFDWVAECGLRPDALVYFTDALGEFPEREPEYPVLWLVTGNGSVPWGERVQFA